MRDSSLPPQFEPGSFRDPDTKIFRHNDVIFRCLTLRALDDWTRLASTSFFDRLSREGHIVQTKQVTDRAALPKLDEKWAAVLEHEAIPFISYPYEWPFLMLKDAALLQLDLTLAAIHEGMTLKDATPFNVQWVGSRPTFIDVGSFTVYKTGDPWAGYRQFCNQFLYPLFLQAYKNVSYHPWLRGSLEGIEVGQLNALMSIRDYMRPGVLAHVYLQAKAQSRYEAVDRDIKEDLRTAGFGVGLIKNNLQRLRRIIERLEWEPQRSIWSEYTKEHSYEDTDLRRKGDFVQRVLARRRWSLVWDIGCNTGTYSRLSSEHADYVLALDGDHLALDRLYAELKQEGNQQILPLFADVADPTPGLGWKGLERRPLGDRGTPDLILALALIHHLIIGRNIPLNDLIEWLAQFGSDLVIEFVGHDDPMVKRLLRNRTGQSIEYSAEALELALTKYFGSVTQETLESGTRTLYYAQARPNDG
jgi:SAM-dependent methyltransferase